MIHPTNSGLVIGTSSLENKYGYNAGIPPGKMSQHYPKILQTTWTEWVLWPELVQELVLHYLAPKIRRYNKVKYKLYVANNPIRVTEVDGNPINQNDKTQTLRPTACVIPWHKVDAAYTWITKQYE